MLSPCRWRIVASMAMTTGVICLVTSVNIKVFIETWFESKGSRDGPSTDRRNRHSTISLGGSSQLGSGGMFALDPPTVASAVGFGSGGYGVTTSGSNNAGQAGVLILEY